MTDGARVPLAHATRSTHWDFGRHVYLPGKDLALFAWPVADMPIPPRCASMVPLPGGGAMPELNRFDGFGRAEAITLVGATWRACWGWWSARMSAYSESARCVQLDLRLKFTSCRITSGLLNST